MVKFLMYSILIPEFADSVKMVFLKMIWREHELNPRLSGPEPTFLTRPPPQPLYTMIVSMSLDYLGFSHPNLKITLALLPGVTTRLK